jgi:Raf kinase inhibitor-like YbhB/YbcL family protein
MPLVIMNSGWTDGGDIPAKYAGAAGVSPALSWSGAPMTTQSFLLIMHDMDVAPQRGADDVLHWIMWDIPATTTMLPEGLKAGDQADGSRIGRGITGQNAYFGPGPPAGHPAHHYVIELYALDAKLGLPATATRAEVMTALAGHVVARGAYYGKFKPA